jgi:DNA polymerase-4
VLRRIIHVDMDAFYASVEQRDDPSLRSRPVAVGGQPDTRGVVAAASYEARAFGVRAAMSMAKAVRLCPDLIIVRPDFARYKAASESVFRIFREATPLVEPLSLDEAYLDVTENAWGETLATSVARRLKARIREDTGLIASAGVAPNKFLAKIASGWKKPDGLTVISPDRVESFLQRLPVDALWGVGPVTARKLRARGIERLVDVRTVDPVMLQAAVGSLADWLLQLAQGIDDRPVVPNRAPKSCGSERTYADDLTDTAAIAAEVARLATDCAAWLVRRELYARTVTIKVRYDDFTTITRSHSDAPTRDGGALVARAVELLEKTDAGARPVRLLGVSVHNLSAALPPETAARGDRLPFDDSDRHMLKGTRDGIVKRLQPVSVHGQIICDVFFTTVDDPDGQIQVARLGPESTVGNVEAGDRVVVEYLVGVPVKVTRVVPA